MQTLSSQAIRIKQWLGEMHCLVVFYYCQRFYQVAIERNKILRYENLDKLSQSIDMRLSLAEFPINFNILKEPT